MNTEILLAFLILMGNTTHVFEEMVPLLNATDQEAFRECHRKADREIAGIYKTNKGADFKIMSVKCTLQ